MRGQILFYRQMKKLRLLLLTLIAFIGFTESYAQVLLNDSTIGIIPYFSKNDTVIYYYNTFTANYNDKDTVVTENMVEKIMVVCTKESEKKGYTLELTLLDGQNLIDTEDNAEEQLKVQVADALFKSYIGLKATFTIDPYGKNLTIENPGKVIKDMTERTKAATDSLTQIFPSIAPLIAPIMSAFMESFKNNPDALVKEEFDEMAQMFEFHGNYYDYDKRKVIENESDTAVVVVQACPKEGEQVKDGDDYRILMTSRQRTQLSDDYSDKMADYLRQLSLVGQNVTNDQIKSLVGDKMPENGASLTVVEQYKNDYFGDGWPKDLLYVIATSYDEVNWHYEQKGVKWKSISHKW